MKKQPDFRFWSQFIRKSVNYRVMLFHFNPSATYRELQKWRSGCRCLGRRSGAMLQWYANTREGQRGSVMVSQRSPTLQCMIGPARSLPGIAIVTNTSVLHSGIMQCLSNHPKMTSVVDQLTPSYPSPCNIVLCPDPTLFQGKGSGEHWVLSWKCQVRSLDFSSTLASEIIKKHTLN